jgi:glycosyltransferase involved in cell wall biosynthesis
VARRLHVLGTRGIPNRYGGFEAFTERLAPWLAARGWDVRVYCQNEAGGPWREETWHGVRLVHVPVDHPGARGSIAFDWKSARVAIAQGGLLLTLGHNTGAFFVLHKLAGRSHVVNMGGLDWKRPKWSLPAKAWLYVNAWLAGWLADEVIADHPEIEKRIAGRPGIAPITMIPYGADARSPGDPSPLRQLELEPDRFGLVIARPEPENSILEMVTAWSLQPRGLPLVVLGAFDFERHPYHRRVRDAAGPEVRFPGGLYDTDLVAALRTRTCLYLHGHTVGGTNPSLVEALGAGSPTLAHDNVFNRWVAGNAARYFSDVPSCASEISRLLDAREERAAMSAAARTRHAEAFRWDDVLRRYEELLLRYV